MPLLLIILKKQIESAIIYIMRFLNWKTYFKILNVVEFYFCIKSNF